jgi:hypothetical protein
VLPEVSLTLNRRLQASIPTECMGSTIHVHSSGTLRELVAFSCVLRRDELDGSGTVSSRMVVAFFALELLLAELRWYP